MQREDMRITHQDFWLLGSFHFFVFLFPRVFLIIPCFWFGISMGVKVYQNHHVFSTSRPAMVKMSISGISSIGAGSGTVTSVKSDLSSDVASCQLYKSCSIFHNLPGS